MPTESSLGKGFMRPTHFMISDGISSWNDLLERATPTCLGGGSDELGCLKNMVNVKEWEAA